MTTKKKRHTHDWRRGTKGGTMILWCRTCHKICSQDNPLYKKLVKTIDKVHYA